MKKSKTYYNLTCHICNTNINIKNPYSYNCECKYLQSPDTFSIKLDPRKLQQPALDFPIRYSILFERLYPLQQDYNYYIIVPILEMFPNYTTKPYNDIIKLIKVKMLL